MEEKRANNKCGPPAPGHGNIPSYWWLINTKLFSVAVQHQASDWASEEW